MTLLRKLIKLQREPLIDKLLKYVDDYDIYAHFLGFEPELHESMCSQLRDNDSTPSFTLYLPTRIPNVRPEEVWWKDQATGEYGTVFYFAKRFAFFQYNVQLKSFIETIKFIDEEMELGMFGSIKEAPVRKKRSVKLNRPSTEIKFKARPYTRVDIEYWKRYWVITMEILTRFNVHSVKQLLDEHNFVRAQFPSSHLAFAYVCYDKVKLYQPLAPKERKWRNTCPTHYIFGLEQLRGKDTLIITKALKDVMCFIGLCDVDAIAPQSETADIPLPIIEAIKKKYKRVIVVMDFDLAGVKMANKLKKHFEVRFVSTKRTLINKKYACTDKDISDYLELRGLEPAKKLMKSWNLPLNTL